jgi:hypothetical protein
LTWRDAVLGPSAKRAPGGAQFGGEEDPHACRLEAGDASVDEKSRSRAAAIGFSEALQTVDRNSGL